MNGTRTQTARIIFLIAALPTSRIHLKGATPLPSGCLLRSRTLHWSRTPHRVPSSHSQYPPPASEPNAIIAVKLTPPRSLRHRPRSSSVRAAVASLKV
ncbi:hypothetical protein OH76DRAFT_1408632 [Lentinus brumalis]|uniref:Uncharacterized protein n=1 Tax=Lentinus brumalis TaxID=2498619 RepID=A0A371CX24_9APHY|nr:hypothetical protein OH76DRAFT_1408632 [Polyporus brumalis]